MNKIVYCVLRIAYCVLRIAYCVLRIALFLSLPKDCVWRIADGVFTQRAFMRMADCHARSIYVVTTLTRNEIWSAKLGPEGTPQVALGFLLAQNANKKPSQGKPCTPHTEYETRNTEYANAKYAIYSLGLEENKASFWIENINGDN